MVKHFHVLFPLLPLGVTRGICANDVALEASRSPWDQLHDTEQLGLEGSLKL